MLHDTLYECTMCVYPSDKRVTYKLLPVPLIACVDCQVKLKHSTLFAKASETFFLTPLLHPSTQPRLYLVYLPFPLTRIIAIPTHQRDHHRPVYGQIHSSHSSRGTIPGGYYGLEQSGLDTASGSRRC